MKLVYAVLFAAFISFNTLAQSVNDYKYVIVPDRYSWAGEADKHQVNSLTTFLFKKYGFDAYQLGEILPGDMNAGGCNVLTADVTENSSLVRTKLKVTLKDCKGDIVFVSQEGTSKAKEYKRAYHEALRDAFNSINELEYAYNGKKEQTQTAVQVQEEKVVPVKVKETSLVQKVDEQSKIMKPLPQSQIDKTVGLETPAVTPKIGSTTLGKNVGIYRSLDGSYYMNVDEEKIVFYEGEEIIGVMVTKPDATYDVETNEFSGKGYFSNNQFIVNRKIKGLQGTVQMIFEK